MSAKFPTELQAKSRGDRLRDIALGSVGIGIWLYGLAATLGNGIDENFWFAQAYLLPLIVLSLFCLARAALPTKRVLTKQGLALRAAAEAAKSRSQTQRDEAISRWWANPYVRYISAVAFFVGAYYLVQESANREEAVYGWMAAGLALWGAWRAREIFIPLVLIVLCLWLISVIPSMSVPGAIIVGAIIIAWTIAATRR